MKIVALGAHRRQTQTELTLKIRFVALTVFLILTFAVAAFARSEFSGKVVWVADGDTITVLAPGNQQVMVRLYGIDCPEKGKPLARRHGVLLPTGLLAGT